MVSIQKEVIVVNSEMGEIRISVMGEGVKVQIEFDIQAQMSMVELAARRSSTLGREVTIRDVIVEALHLERLLADGRLLLISDDGQAAQQLIEG